MGVESSEIVVRDTDRVQSSYLGHQMDDESFKDNKDEVEKRIDYEDELRHKAYLVLVRRHHFGSY